MYFIKYLQSQVYGYTLISYDDIRYYLLPKRFFNVQN